LDEIVVKVRIETEVADEAVQPSEACCTSSGPAFRAA
jgi:hypothetical protein